MGYTFVGELSFAAALAICPCAVVEGQLLEKGPARGLSRDFLPSATAWSTREDLRKKHSNDPHHLCRMMSISPSSMTGEI